MKPSHAELGRHCDQFRLMVNAVEDYAIYLIDTNGLVASWNSGATRIKGYAADEIVGKHFSNFYTQEDQRQGKPAYALQVAKSLGKFSDEGLRVRKDGSQFWAGILITSIYEDGELFGFAKVTRDLTEQKRTEKVILDLQAELEARVVARTAALEAACDELRRNRQRNETIVNAISAVIWRWDLASGTYQSVPSWHEYVGFDEEQVRGWNWSVALHPDDRERVNMLFREALKTGERFETEYRILRKQGEYRHVSMRGMPLLNDDESTDEWVGICVDITDQKNLEEQLRHSKKIEAVGQLAGGVAHDFNNILTVILSYGELLLTCATLQEKERRMLIAMVESGQRAAALTKQLLTFSRRSLMLLKPLDVNVIVSEIESMLRRMIGEDILIQTIVDPEIGPVHADAGQLGQVLMNLAVNARDAMPEGGMLTIETKNVVLDERFVNTHVEVERGQYVLLTVSDTGIGMSPEVRSRIFEPFFTTKVAGEGTGLGLSVVHGIVKQFGGKIGAYSEVGFGTVFKIYLPVMTHATNAGDSTSIVKTRRIGIETVLVVDDDLAVSEIAEFSLNADGYKILRASSAKEALQIAESHTGSIDLLITDVVMPGMSGPELAEKMITLFPQIAILYLSGYTDDAVVRHGLLRAEVNFLQKPFTPLGLAKCVQDIFEQ